MGFTDWFGLILKNNKDVEVKKVKQQSVEMGGMVAGSPSSATAALGKMLDQQKAPTKILMVQDGEYNTRITDYALKMAQRLDCEIIALDVSDKPLQFSGERRERESDRFIEISKKNAEQFTMEAANQGIMVKHVLDINSPEEVIARVSEADAGIRYVLSKPEETMVTVKDQRQHVPVFDLRCSRL